MSEQAVFVCFVGVFFIDRLMKKRKKEIKQEINK